MKTTEVVEKEEKNLPWVAQALEDGKVGIIQTENVYGFIINANCKASARKVYDIKGRDLSKPLSYFTTKEQMDEYGILCEGARKIAGRWPDAVSVIVKKKDSVPSYITANMDSVLLVCIDSYTESLAKLCSVPIAATSANLSGEDSITSFSSVYEKFNGIVDFIVKGEDSSRGQASTIINFSQRTPFIQRLGPVSYLELKELINDLEPPVEV